MSDYAFFVLLGAGAAAIIAAFGLGLVVTYQGAGVVNFAFGGMATWVTMVYGDLRQGSYPFPVPGLPPRYHFDGDVGFPVALALSMATAVLLGIVVHVLVFRPLRHAPALAKVVASVGLVLVLISLVDRRLGDSRSIRADPILPREPVTLFGDVTVPRDGLWLVAIVVAVAVGLWWMRQHTRLGLVIRAAAENEKGAILLGFSPDVLAGTSLVVATLIGGFVGILASPMIQLNATVYTFGFLVPALGAALIGRMRLIWSTLLTGLAIGFVQASFTKLQTDLSWFPKYGAREGVPLLVIIVAMALRGSRFPGRAPAGAGALPVVPASRLTPLNVLTPFAAAVAALVLLGPLWRGAIMTTLIACVFALSFVVLTGFSGQTSLSQMAFAGVAGFALSKLATNWGLPFPVAPLLAAGVGTLLGAVVAVPAMRVRGTDLAILTLAFGVTVSEFVFKNPRFIGDIASGGAKVPNPSIGSFDFGPVFGTTSSRPVFGVFLALVVLVLAVGVANLRRSSSGRAMLAMRSSEQAAAALGVNVARQKLVVFATSSFLASIGGCLIAYRFGSVSETSFGVVASLSALAAAYIGGITSVSGALTSGVLAASGIAFYTVGRLSGSAGSWEVVIGGVLLIVTVILNPSGVASLWQRRRPSPS